MKSKRYSLGPSSTVHTTQTGCMRVSIDPSQAPHGGNPPMVGAPHASVRQSREMSGPLSHAAPNSIVHCLQAPALQNLKTISQTCGPRT